MAIAFGSTQVHRASRDQHGGATDERFVSVSGQASWGKGALHLGLGSSPFEWGIAALSYPRELW